MGGLGLGGAWLHFKRGQRQSQKAPAASENGQYPKKRPPSGRPPKHQAGSVAAIGLADAALDREARLAAIIGVVAAATPRSRVVIGAVAATIVVVIVAVMMPAADPHVHAGRVDRKALRLGDARDADIHRHRGAERGAEN